MLTVEPINAGMWMDSHLQVADESSGSWYDSGYPESQPLLTSTATCEGRGELLMDQGQAGSPQHHIGTMNSGTGGITKDQPDPDAIKMFVGQVPRHMDENDLRKMFEEYGQVYQINVLRDKVTGHSKGCCFVTFYTRKAALHAQNELHNIKTMAGMHHPIQMKPADTENRNERKLFIGMLAKKCSENDVRLMFSPFGQIEECTVLRDQNGQSKGCAFVTFSSRQCAISAIKAIHQSQTMEGCSAPVVVKFADTQKEKDAKRLQQMAQNLWNAASMNVGAINPQYLAQLSPNQSNLTGLNVPQLGGLNALAASQLLAASQGAVANNPQGIQNLQNIAALQGSSLTNSSTLNSNGDLSSSNLQALMANLSGSPSMNPISLATLAALTGAGNQGLQTLNPSGSVVGQSSTPTSMGAVTPVSSLAIGNVTGSSLSTIASLGGLNGLGSTANGAGLESLGSYSGIQQYTAYPTYAQSALQSASSPAGKQIEGPEGANLFIYHLPQEFSDSDLAQTFMPFGNVISAKVFIDKQTNLSKCFGFVSYDNPMCSQAAIQAMNGFQIGTKRLKVQLKRSKDASKPY